MQQGVHEHKSSPEARPVGRAVKSITCSGRDEWLFASLCRAKQAIRNRQKGKYVSFKVIRHSEVSDGVRHVRPYSILDQSGTRKSGRSVGVPEFYSRVKQRSTLVRIKGRRQQEVFSLLGVFRDRLASLGSCGLQQPLDLLNLGACAPDHRLIQRTAALGGWSRLFKCYPNCIGRKGRTANLSSPLKATACRRSLRPVRIPAYQCVCCYIRTPRMVQQEERRSKEDFS